MNRRCFLQRTAGVALATSLPSFPARLFAADSPATPHPFVPPATAQDWLAKWEKYVLAESRNRYCDKEMGEELGWLVSPFLNAFHYGYLATDDPKWIELLIDWTDACLKRAQTEPDGFPGWPKGDGGGNASSEYSSDSLLGEAMLLRPVMLLAPKILRDNSLQFGYGEKTRSYIAFAKRIFQKWVSRDCWRPVKNGGVWVVPAFGIDKKSPAKWSKGYDQRKTTGFTNPANKQNLIASWLLALSDATGDSAPRERAEAWWRLMRSRMTTRENGKYFVWNYWEPAGPWDYNWLGAKKHWVGVHPNGGYYAIDVEGIVTAYEHGLVFKREDIHKLIATNRDFMWNQKIDAAKFQRIDGGSPDRRWPNTPGVLWSALAPYDDTLHKIFLANFKPDAWSSLAATPWAISISSHEP